MPKPHQSLKCWPCIHFRRIGPGEILADIGCAQNKRGFPNGCDEFSREPGADDHVGDEND